jgi:undecaprenyl-phosphate 4-deoxy-4-formamido-L-arabinose transferase
MKISVVIPCYHSRRTLGGVTADLERMMATRPELDYEIILVNDNPPDETWDLIQRLREENPRIHGICFSRNFGQHSALMAGYRQVTGDIVVSMDDDGQNPPSEIFRLIDAVDSRTDIVYADYPRKQHSRFRNLGSRLSNRMFSWMLGKPRELYLASYWAAKRFVIDEMIRCESPFPYVDGLALQSTTRIINVPVDHLPRAEGESGYTMFSLLRLWLNAFTSFSVKPLRIATVAGSGTALAGLIVGLVLVIRKLILRENIDAGWTSMMALMLFLFGVLMIMMGLVGEYVGRVFISMNRSPQYVIEYDTARNEPDPFREKPGAEPEKPAGA